MMYRKNRNLIEETMDDSLIIYDELKEKTHVFNSSASIIWNEVLSEAEFDLEESCKWFIEKVDISDYNFEDIEKECMGFFNLLISEGLLEKID